VEEEWTLDQFVQVAKACEFGSQVWTKIAGLRSESTAKMEALEHGRARLPTTFEIVQVAFDRVMTAQREWDNKVEVWTDKNEREEDRLRKRLASVAWMQRELEEEKRAPYKGTA